MGTIQAMLEEHKSIVICRGVYDDIPLKTIETLYKDGIRLAEVTFDQKSRDYRETLDAITMLEEHFRGRMAIGVGTVISPAQAELVYQTKAVYIISSNVNGAVIRKTKELDMLFISGTLSPSEVLNTRGYGVDYVKLLPAARMTVSYIKDLMGLISHVEFITTVGIIEEDIAELAAVDCTGYDISERLTDRRVIQEDRLEKL